MCIALLLYIRRVLGGEPGLHQRVVQLPERAVAGPGPRHLGVSGEPWLRGGARAAGGAVPCLLREPPAGAGAPKHKTGVMW